jgi:hypothetical protein
MIDRTERKELFFSFSIVQNAKCTTDLVWWSISIKFNDDDDTTTSSTSTSWM